jgi:hypothetical protein
MAKTKNGTTPSHAHDTVRTRGEGGTTTALMISVWDISSEEELGRLGWPAKSLNMQNYLTSAFTMLSQFFVITSFAFVSCAGEGNTILAYRSAGGNNLAASAGMALRLTMST